MALFEDTFPPYVPFGSRYLSVMTPRLQGTDVAVVQAVYNLMLNTMNPPMGPMGSPVTLDGVYGPATAQAVRNIQSYFGLSVDGIAGPDTYFVYGEGVGPHTTYGGPVFDSRQLSQGSVGGDVRILQNRLNCFRYATQVGGPADGYFGSRTASAVLSFKQDAVANGDTGLTSNSVVGDGTFNACFLYTFAGGRAIESGRNGFDVVFLQVILTNLSYYTGRITGYYDLPTIGAVRAFQSAQGITVDGVVGPQTFYRIGLNNHVMAPNPLGLAFPVTPVSVVSTCTVGLTSSYDIHFFGSATHAINQSEGFESLNVVGNTLPEPSSFGPAYGAYAFTLTNPSTTMVVARELMVELPASGNWAGSYSPGVSSIVNGVVQVYPTASGSASGPYGPLVLAGDLRSCH